MKLSLWRILPSPRHILFSIVGIILIATVFTGHAFMQEPDADIFITTSKNDVHPNDVFTADVRLRSNVPVNAVESEIHFDPESLEFIDLTFDKSLLNLWVKEPFYDPVERAVVFIGGTTRADGFTGEDSIVTITFKAKRLDSTVIDSTHSLVLRHDGEGSDTHVHALNTDVIIHEITPHGHDNVLIDTDQTSVSVIERRSGTTSVVFRLDFNSDGKISLRDISVFFSSLFGL